MLDTVSKKLTIIPCVYGSFLFKFWYSSNNIFCLEKNVGLLLKDCPAMKEDIDAVNKEVAAVKKKSDQVIKFLKDIAKTLDTIGGGYNKDIEATTWIGLPKNLLYLLMRNVKKNLNQWENCLK